MLQLGKNVKQLDDIQILITELPKIQIILFGNHFSILTHKLIMNEFTYELYKLNEYLHVKLRAT